MKNSIRVRRLGCLIGATCALWAGSAISSDNTQRAASPINALPAKNLFLADSFYAVPHSNPGQVDSTSRPGPIGPTRRLSGDEITYADDIGLGHYGYNVSSPYPGGRRVLWSSGHDRIVKLDYGTLKPLAAYALPGKPQIDVEQVQNIEKQLSELKGAERFRFASENAANILGTGLEGTYTMLDRDGNFYVGTKRGLIVYGDEKPGDPASKIVVRRTWSLPEAVTGSPVGINMTYDGRLVIATWGGDLLVVSRDFKQVRSIKLKHSEEAAAYNAEMEKQGRVGYGWVRNSFAVDDKGGIYIASNNWMHKVVWDGKQLSTDPNDGAWVEPYNNSMGTGTGSTPALMGFGDDRFVVITDGDDLMNVVLFWRDELPKGVSKRLAGKLPANMCDPTRTALQSEQAVVVGGYGAYVVNNEPAHPPAGFPRRYNGLLVGLLGDDPAFTPHGMQKFQWNPSARKLENAWCNNEIASPNAVPFVSLASNKIYTAGVRNGEWTLEGIDTNSGESAFHYVLGGPRYNSTFAGVVIDAEGHPLYGTMLGMMRLNVPAHPESTVRSSANP